MATKPMFSREEEKEGEGEKKMVKIGEELTPLLPQDWCHSSPIWLIRGRTFFPFAQSPPEACDLV